MTASSSSPALSPDQGSLADLPGIADRVRAIMLAGALGDALTAQPEPAQAPAAPPEGVSTAAGGQVLGIPSPGAAQGGSPGAGAASGGAAATIADAAAVSGPTTLQLQPLRISADTQLSLYTMDGLLEWHVTDGGGVQLWLEPERAGSSTVVLAADDLDTTATRLAAAGMADGGPEPGGGARVLRLADPDGNRVVVGLTATIEGGTQVLSGARAVVRLP